MRKLKPEPKAITMKGKWRVISFIPKRCRKPRYMVGIRLSNGTDICLQALGDVYACPHLCKEDAEWWADVLNTGRG